MNLQTRILFAAVAAIGVSAITATVPSPAHAVEKCDPLPDVEWWNTSHAKMIKFVEVKHKGDWRPYVKSWEKQLDVLQDLHDANRSAYIRSRKLSLEGDVLLDYIDKVAKRVEIINCLRANYLDEKVGTGGNAEPVKGFGKGRAFSSKKGAEVSRQTSIAKSKEVFLIQDREVNIKISTRCDGTTAVFEVANQGEKWPRLGRVATYRVDDKKVMTQRNVRFAKDQIMTFRLVERNIKYQGDTGMFINPSWFDRKFEFDARINCKRRANS